eukprot:1640217-Pyramimonas_sp.AAC.1
MPSRVGDYAVYYAVFNGDGKEGNAIRVNAVQPLGEGRPPLSKQQSVTRHTHTAPTRRLVSAQLPDASFFVFAGHGPREAVKGPSALENWWTESEAILEPLVDDGHA